MNIENILFCDIDCDVLLLFYKKYIYIYISKLQTLYIAHKMFKQQTINDQHPSMDRI